MSARALFEVGRREGSTWNITDRTDRCTEPTVATGLDSWRLAGLLTKGAIGESARNAANATRSRNAAGWAGLGWFPNLGLRRGRSGLQDWVYGEGKEAE
jgi:hypothetical protein